MMILAIVTIISTMATIVLLTKYEVPSENKDALYMLIGALVSSYTIIISYFFGSSKGSADKTDALVNNKPKE